MRLLMSVLAALITSSLLAQDLAIENATLVSPERDTPVEGLTVLVGDGRILGIQPASIPHQAERVIDAERQYLTPGLIDSHVHLYHATGLRPGLVERERSLALQEAYFEQMPRSYLYWGFTTLVELNADFETNRAFEAAPIRPRLFHCGEGLVTSNGFMAHQAHLPVEDAFPNFLHDRHVTPELPEGSDPAEHTPAATLETIQASGGICVKIYFEDAPWMPNGPEWPLPSQAIFSEVVREARERGLTVFLHGTTPAAHRMGLAAGVDVMAHGPWDMPVDLLEPIAPPMMFELADDIAEAGLQLQPTIRTLGQTRSMFEPDILQDADWLDVVPSSYVEFLRTDAQPQRDTFIEVILGNRLDEALIPHLMDGYQGRYQQFLRYLATNSDALVFGTDTAVGTFGWGNPPGLNGHWEMRELAEAGISPADILDMATRRNAETLNLADEIGTIEVGKRADLLLMQDNPLRSIDAYRSITTVILNGAPMDRAGLSARHYEETDQ
ncbi:amidohydrolase family protein [Maricaulis sp. MIT060901]|uniref:amidohydrolase family protein n=1 Tax=Maricaulis sp. MIT060901 TaxID=3096993 RepID=UPI00399B5316